MTSTVFSAAAFTSVKPPASSSAIVADRPRGSHDLVIDAIALGKDVPTGEILRSAPFTVGGVLWRIQVHPNDFPRSTTVDDDEKYTYRPRNACFSLVLDQRVAKPVKARIKLSVIMVEQRWRRRGLFFREPNPTPKVQKEWEGTQNFAAKGYGTDTCFQRSDLAKLLRRHKADHFTVRCEVVVINGFRTEARPAAPPVSIPPSDLSGNLGFLLAAGMLADVVFEVGGEAFPAHRCVLAVRAPVICRELLGAAAAKDAPDGVVRVDGVRPRVFGALLRFAYTDALPEMNKDKEGASMYRDLLVAADRFDMVRLKMICEDKLCRLVDLENVGFMLALAQEHRCNGLKKACADVLNNAPAPAKGKAQ